MNVEIYRLKLETTNTIYLWVYYGSRNIFYNINSRTRLPSRKAYSSISKNKSYYKVELSDLIPEAREMILKDYPELREEDKLENFYNQYQMS